MKEPTIIILGYPIKSTDHILQKRLQKGLNLAIRNNISQIIVSGHGRSDEIEAAYMADWLVHHGFKGQIIQEKESRDTIENLVFCAKIIQHLAIQEVIIVTSWFHAKRTRTIAEQVLQNTNFSLSLARGGGQELVTAEKKYQAMLEEVLNHKNQN